MPTYSYRCTECENAFDIQQAFTDDSLTQCPACNGRLRKVFSAIGVSFTGSGFYRNDSRADQTSAANKSESTGAGKSDAGAAKSDSGSGKSDSGSGSGSGSGSSSSSSGSGSGSSGSGSGSSGSGSGSSGSSGAGSSSSAKASASVAK
ncbi:FmdB family zinc ribbon protein [Marisediminicola antarctica]|uniref:FmdB family zinc ribbon protein n=1 Tax=Marisediminicola antarctica TaxID=674079 RepID=UPI00137ACB3F|nr:FmdB family zinc ribbon protein [Marisediminicola antarctica]